MAADEMYDPLADSWGMAPGPAAARELRFDQDDPAKTLPAEVIEIWLMNFRRRNPAAFGTQLAAAWREWATGIKTGSDKGDPGPGERSEPGPG